MAITKHLTNDQVKRLMAEVKELRQFPVQSTSHAMSIFIELMLISGMRTDELCHLTVSCFDWSGGTLNILRPAKGSDRGTVRLPGALLDAIRVAVDEHGLTGPDLFSNIGYSGGNLVARKRMLQREWIRVRFKVFGEGFNLGLHSLRHTGALAVYASSKDIVAVQKFLRHRSMVTTQVYLVGLITPDFGGIMSRFIEEAKVNV